MSEVTSVNGKTGAVVLTAADVEAVPTSAEGQPNGVATLDESGALPEGQLPSSVVTGSNEPVATTGVSHVFNVKDGAFGAKGDGEADDTEAIKAAVAAVAANGGGVIYFPPGTYLYSKTITPVSNCHWRGAGPNASIIRCKAGSSATYFIKGSLENGGFTKENPCTNISFEDLGFDLNGNDSEFGGVLQFNEGLYGCWVRGCKFFDSNAPSFTKTVAEGDGEKTTFEYTFDNEGEKNRKPLSQSISITDGKGQTFIDDGMGNWVSVSSPLQPQPTAVGGISYGGHAVKGVLSITFPKAPPAGAQIKVTYQAVRQRQHIAFLGAAEVFIENNILTHGGRIKCGRPGNRIIIQGNTLQDVNDNAITVVAVNNATYGITTDLIITDNIIRNPCLKGIYIGADGETETQETLTTERVIVTDNIVTGDFQNAVFAQLPRVTREVRIDRNEGRITHPYQGEAGYALIDVRFVNEAVVPGKTLSVCDNIVTGVKAGAAGIWLRNFNGAVCCRNQVSEIADRGIRIDGTANAVIAHNIVNAGAPISFESGEPANVIVTSNVCVTAAAGIPAIRIRSASASHLKLQGNVCGGPGYGFESKTTVGEADFDLVDNDFSGCGEVKMPLEKVASTSYIAKNKGWNPQGAKTVAVPASGTAVAASNYDQEFYVTANIAGSVEMQVAGGPKITIPEGTVCLVRVPAGKTVTPTYAKAPTWVVERL
jgi:hypothetical protein